MRHFARARPVSPRTVMIVMFLLSGGSFSLGQSPKAEILDELGDQGFGLVEVGTYSRMEILWFPNRYFSNEPPPLGALLIAVSREGDALVLARDANSTSVPTSSKLTLVY